MNAKLQSVEIQRAVLCDHNFTIKHTSLRKLLFQRLNQFREVSIQWLSVATLNQNLVSITKDQRSKTVPFWLEKPRTILWQFTHSFGEHRKYWRINRQVHYRIINSDTLSLIH